MPKVLTFHAEHQVTSKVERRRAWAIVELGRPLVPDEDADRAPRISAAAGSDAAAGDVSGKTGVVAGGGGGEMRFFRMDGALRTEARDGMTLLLRLDSSKESPQKFNIELGSMPVSGEYLGCFFLSFVC